MSPSGRHDWNAVCAVVAKDFTAIRRSKAVVLPMLFVPVLLLVVLPFGIGLVARAAHPGDLHSILSKLPGGVARPILRYPPRQQLVILVDGYLLAPLFLIVPLMVASVLAADAFAGEKERRTLEGLLHLPIEERDLFYAKVLGAWLPAVVISWVGFAVFCVVANGVAWPVVHRVFVPTALWIVMIVWLAPAVAALGMGVMVRVSARARTAQEANQLGGAVILPLIFATVAQSTGLLLVSLPIALGVGATVWAIAFALLARGASRFTRDRLAATL
ncbi:MAG TPA: ABC transporter permease subunit [Acidimicrobiales bacterium]|nr:ABC transporter permease subunit [Acidimicrobiales bacterium]